MCIVCGENVNVQVSCYLCNVTVCSDCCLSYLKICLKDKKIPNCFDPGCLGEFLYSQMKKLGVEQTRFYEKILPEYLKVYYSNEISQITSTEKIIQQLRQEKLNFIIKKFPITITRVIEISLSSKLKRVKTKSVKSMLQDVTRECFNTFCVGKLNQDYVCIICDTKFCKKCEKKMNVTTHTCNVQDIASVEYVGTLIKCPKCFLPILRSYGCDLMTCTSCKTNFNYQTGKIIRQGNNHNQSITLDRTITLAKKYLKSCTEPNNEIYKQLNKIDQEKPVFSIETFINHIKNNSNGEILSKEYEKMKMYKLNIKQYIQNVEYLGQQIDNNTLKKCSQIKLNH